VAEHIDLIREAARVYRAGHTPTDAGRRRIAELLEHAAAREDKHLALATGLPGHVVEAPGAGDEAWLAWEIAVAILGREASDG